MYLTVHYNAPEGKIWMNETEIIGGQQQGSQQITINYQPVLTKVLGAVSLFSIAFFTLSLIMYYGVMFFKLKIGKGHIGVSNRNPVINGQS